MDAFDKTAAVRALAATLWDALRPRDPSKMRRACRKALKLSTGIKAVDAALQRVEVPDTFAADDIDRARAQARIEFLCDLLEALAEPHDAGSGRGRKRTAEKAANHLRAAGDLLASIGNKGMRDAFRDAAAVVAACGARERIEHIDLSDTPIVPGMHAGVTRRPAWKSSFHAGARGPASHRAELIRFVCRHLAPSTSAATVAGLMRGVVGVQCTADNVRRARTTPPAAPRTAASWDERVGRLLQTR